MAQRLVCFLRRFEHRVWVLSVIQLITAAGFSLSLPFLSLYLYQVRGLSMTLVGTLILITAIIAALARLAGGALVDRVGRRPVLLWVVGMRVILFIGMAGLMATQGSIWIIGAVYLGLRVVGSLSRSTVSAMIADLASEERRTEAYGLLRVGENFGFAAGPAVGGYLATVFPYAALFAFTALTSAIAFVLVALFARETYQVLERPEELSAMLATLNNRRFVSFIGLSLLVFAVMGQLVSTLSIFTVDRLGLSEAQFGALLTLNGLLVAALQFPIAHFVQRLSPPRVLILGSLLFGLGYLALGWFWAFPSLMGAIAVVTLGEMAFAPTALAVAANLAPPDRRGRYMGAFGLAEVFGWSAGPFLGGVLLDAFPASPQAMWAVIASLAFVAAAGFRLWGRQASTPAP